jgi:4-amino-4-deoxy-L-arabinose transferase-like glycosyltransferase
MKSRLNPQSLIPILILAAFVVLATAYSVVNPIYESTDELQHYRFVQYLVATGQLPVQSDQGARIQAHHPPLYYALAALASFWVKPDHAWDYEPEPNPYWGYRYWEVSADNKVRYVHLRDEDWPYRGTALAFHLARWVNVALGALTVWLTYRLARRIAPDRPGLAAAAMATVAFNPQFVYMSGAINNDVIAGAAGAAVLVACLDAIGRPLTDRRAAVIGLLFGLGLLAKFNLVFMLPAIGLALWLARGDDGWRRFARAALIALAVAGLIAGWWFARNQMLYGEATGVEKMNAIWGGRDPIRDFPLALQEIPYAWSTLWGRFGYGQIPMPDVVYQAIFAACLVALGGLLVGWLRRRRSADTTRRGQFGVAALTVFVFASAVFAYMTISTAGPNGRFFFPALPALGVLLAAGLLEWARRWQALAAGIVIVSAFALAVYALYGILAPAYARPSALNETQIASIPNRIDVTFGDAIRLVGYEVDTSQVRVGGRVTVTAYWRALRSIEASYAVFVHLIDADGVIEAQRDTYPGLGNYPTLLWRPGEVFADRYAVHVPDTAYAPLATTVRIGLYQPEGARLAASNGDDGVTLGRVSILARAGEYPNATDVNFDDKVALLGYALDRRSARPGESIRLTTYWTSLGPTDFDYRIFAHVAVGDTGVVWARGPDGPAYRPLSTWAAGEIVIDERVLTLDPNTPPGVYDLQLGWFGKPSSKRLPILAADGHWLGNYLALTRVRVAPPE